MVIQNTLVDNCFRICIYQFTQLQTQNIKKLLKLNILYHSKKSAILP